MIFKFNSGVICTTSNGTSRNKNIYKIHSNYYYSKHD